MRFTISPLCAALGAFALLACSDPAPPTAQGGVYYQSATSSSAPTGTMCAFGAGYTAGVGDPPPDPISINPGKRFTDGEHDTTVTCTVNGDKAVTFSGEIKGPNERDTYIARLAISGKLNEDGTGTAHITELMQGFPYSGDCTLEGVVANGKNQWGDDLVWTRFTCPDMRSGSPGDSCKTTGTIVLENCQ